jgi:hypothetical protein
MEESAIPVSPQPALTFRGITAGPGARSGIGRPIRGGSNLRPRPAVLETSTLAVLERLAQ